MPRATRYAVVLLTVVTLLVVSAVPARAGITFTQFTTPPSTMTGEVGFTFAGNKFVGSIDNIFGATPVLYSTNLTGGNPQPFAPGVSFTPAGEHYVAASYGLGGFPKGDIYVGDSSGGGTASIIHINNAGTASNTFVTGLNGSLVRGILFDTTGSFGNNMIVTTNATTGPNIFVVTSAGVATPLGAGTGFDTEGLDVAPAGLKLGPFTGNLFVGSDVASQVWAVSPTGTITPVASVSNAEEVTFVPLTLGSTGSPLEGLYSGDFNGFGATGDVQFASAATFLAPGSGVALGDLIVTSEASPAGSGVSDVHWNGSIFVVTPIGSLPHQAEDGIFVTPAIIGAVNPAVPEPSTLALLGLGGAALAAWRRWKGRRVKA